MPRRTTDDGPDPIGSDDGEQPEVQGQPAQFSTIEDANGWGEQHYGHLRDEVTAEERSSTRDYASIGHEDINGYHRGTVEATPIMTEYVEERTRNIDSLMDKAGPTPEPVVAYRGVGPDLVDGLADSTGNLTGARFTDPGFMSTALHQDEAGYFANAPGSVVLEMVVPQGARGVYVDAATIARAPSLGESELLLGRNSRVVVDAPTGRVTDQGMAIWQAHIEVD